MPKYHVNDLIQRKYTEEVYELTEWRNNDHIVLTRVSNRNAGTIIDVDMLYENFQPVTKKIAKMWRMLT